MRVVSSTGKYIGISFAGVVSGPRVETDRIIYEIGNEDYAREALKVAEEKIEYKAFKAIDRDKIINQIINKIKQFSKVRNAWIYGSFSRED